MSNNNTPKSINDLLNQLQLRGGAIVCTSSLGVDEISQARESGRMYVDEYGIGYVFLPNWVGFPTTEEQVEQFESDYPIDEPFPDDLMNPNYILLTKEDAIKHTVDYIKNALCVMGIDEIKAIDVISHLKKSKI